MEKSGRLFGVNEECGNLDVRLDRGMRGNLHLE